MVPLRKSASGGLCTNDIQTGNPEVEARRYAYRRVTEEVRAQGRVVNHKRVARIIREDNLLAVRQGWFQPADHSLRGARIYLNLAKRMTLLGPNQLWVADITYFRLTREFVYLAVVLDVFSRKVIGWALGRSLKAQLPICALERTIANRRPPPGVVHHSDQGVQYASRQYLQKLREHEMLPSMSRPANPYDNATCESFLIALKREEIYASTYRDFEDLHERVEEFVERYYNEYPLHLLPQAFVRIRHFGFLASRRRAKLRRRSESDHRIRNARRDW